MAKWFIENMIGMDPPFLQQSVEHRPVVIKQKIPETECAEFKILGLSGQVPNLVIRGYIKSRERIIPIDPAIGKKIITFSCFDEIFIYFFSFKDREMEMYEMKFCCCNNWNVKEIKAYRKGLFGDEEFIETDTEYITVKCAISNLKSQSQYHYNINQEISLEKRYINFEFLNSTYKIQKYQCIFCLRIFKEQNELLNHVNIIHTYYSCECRNGSIRVCRLTAYEDSDEDIFTRDVADSISRVFLVPCSNKHFLFMKNRDGRRFKYPLVNHGLLIEKEYDRLNYLNALASHSNSRALMSGQGVEAEVMRFWNTLRISSEDIKKNLKTLVNHFGLIDSVLKFLELLYKSGLINSQEIQEILGTVKDDKD